MQISSKTEYSVRALTELCNSQAIPLSIREISEKQNLPEKYIEQLFRKLKKNEIIKSLSGSKGGYILNKASEEISLKDIMHAVEDDSSFCGKHADTNCYCQKHTCGLMSIWKEVDEHINDYLGSITLKTIHQRVKES